MSSRKSSASSCHHLLSPAIVPPRLLTFKKAQRKIRLQDGKTQSQSACRLCPSRHKDGGGVYASGGVRTGAAQHAHATTADFPSHWSKNSRIKKPAAACGGEHDLAIIPGTVAHLATCVYFSCCNARTGLALIPSQNLAGQGGSTAATIAISSVFKCCFLICRVHFPSEHQESLLKGSLHEGKSQKVASATYI